MVQDELPLTRLTNLSQTDATPHVYYPVAPQPASWTAQDSYQPADEDQFADDEGLVDDLLRMLRTADTRYL